MTGGTATKPPFEKRHAGLSRARINSDTTIPAPTRKTSVMFRNDTYLRSFPDGIAMYFIPRAVTISRSIPHRDPIHTTEVASDANCSITASPGKTCPAVPPPVHASTVRRSMTAGEFLPHITCFTMMHSIMRLFSVSIVPVLFAVFIAFPAAAEPVEAVGLFPENVRRALEAGALTERFFTSGSPLLAPSNAAGDRIREAIGEQRPRFGFEVLGLFETVESTGLEIYNALLAVSSLEGITYHSASRDTDRTFYHESYAVDSRRARIDDPVAVAVPDSREVAVFQRDATFGGNYYVYRYSFTGNTITLSATNTSTMTYGILPLIRSGNFTTHVVVLIEPDAVVFYGVGAVRTLPVFGMEDRVSASFASRIRAIYSWFSDSVLNRSTRLPR